MSSHISSIDQVTDWTSEEKKKKLCNECLIDFKIYCSANWLHYCVCTTQLLLSLKNNNWERLTAKKVEGVNNSNNNLLIVNTWKQPLSIMLHNYVPLLKYKYWIKITIISTNCNNSKGSIKQIRFACLELCLNSLELYDVTMHKKVHQKICQNTMFQASVNQTVRYPLTSL